MKKFFSTAYTDTAFNIAMLLLRATVGVLLIPHGWQKVQNFSEFSAKFMNFLGLGSKVSLSLVIFAEVLCAGLLVLGLLSRFAALVLVILFSVIVFKVNGGDVFGKNEGVTLFLVASFTVLLVGPGKYSVDGAMGK